MKRNIKQIAVLGSGIMGSRIACHFANVGVEVLLLDMVPNQAKESTKANERNALVTAAFTTAIKSNPAPLYHKDFASRVTLGNFEDDMPKIKNCDWIIEVVVENLEIKKTVFEKVEQYRNMGTIVSSNTSSIPIKQMAEGRSDDFKANFVGTHFFNPPRYLKLLEIIPTEFTKNELIDFLLDFGSHRLGKTTVLCKDTPGFIANRVGVFSIMHLLHSVKKFGFSVEEIDKLTGPVIGRPSSATFRTGDVVGLDTLSKVAAVVAHNCANDEKLSLFTLPDYVQKMLDNQMFGDKTGKGFYLKTKDQLGARKIQQLDLNTLEYVDQVKPKLPLMEQAKSIDNLKDRLAMLFKAQGNAGDFYRDIFTAQFAYAANRIPEITEEIYRLDDALKAGFGYEVGIFEMWDIFGVAAVAELLRKQNVVLPVWLQEMIKAGFESFYKIINNDLCCYDLKLQDYKKIPGREQQIELLYLKPQNTVYKNADAHVLDIGDGVLAVEFHSKMNAIGGNTLGAINKAIDLAEKDFLGLVIGNNGVNFSAGANIGMIFLLAVEQEYDELDMAIQQFQQTTMHIRYSTIPVVVAAKGMTLGGGCETMLHADKVVAAGELYSGLVELGVGVIPAGGGCKEMVLRVSESAHDGDIMFNALQKAFMNIASAKVSTSAYEALEANYLTSNDLIVPNAAHILGLAKQECLDLIEIGYVQPVERKQIKVLGKSAMAQFQVGINGMLMGNYITPYDAKIATKLANIMCGGDLSYPHLVTEKYLLDLEREAFLSLCGERKTLERLESMIKYGKPLRN